MLNQPKIHRFDMVNFMFWISDDSLESHFQLLDFINKSNSPDSERLLKYFLNSSKSDIHHQIDRILNEKNQIVINQKIFISSSSKNCF
jgi:hypothetical protein